MRWTPARATAIFALSSLAVLGCGKDTIQVGVVLPLTGKNSTYGEPIRKGVELALEELRAEGDGVPIALSIVDTESDPGKAKSLLEQQYEAGALLALGGVTTDEAKEMIGVIDDKDRVLLSPSATSPVLTGISRNFFRICPSDFAAATRMAQFASQDLGVTKTVVITEVQAYAKGIQEVFQPAFEGYGGEVLEVIEVPPETSDLSGLMDRVMTLQPEAVYLAGFEKGIGGMIQELRRLKYNGHILTTDAFSLPDAIARVGKPAAGVFLTQSVFELDSEHAHVKRFVDGFQARYGEAPDLYAARGYDALKVLVAALEGRAALPSEVIRGLRDIKEFPGVTGAIQFDEKGDVRKYPRIYVIGEDSVLYDHTERVRKQKEEVRKKREELMKRLEAIKRQAEKIDN